MYMWIEEWIERLSEGAASSRVDMNPGFHIIEGDQTLIIINKHPHLLELSSQREIDIRVIIKYQHIIVVEKSPVTRLRGPLCLTFSVDGLSVPVLPLPSPDHDRMRRLLPPPPLLEALIQAQMKAVEGSKRIQRLPVNGSKPKALERDVTEMDPALRLMLQEKERAVMTLQETVEMSKRREQR
ncbi:unnamed protein product [Boreogadus saida]